jgi:hypothetical protein
LALPALAFGAPTNIQVKDDFFQPQNPAPRPFQTGASFRWQRGAGSNGDHNVRQDAGLFNSGAPTSGSINFSISASAGSFHYYCSAHGSPAGGMTGVVKVRPIFSAAPTGTWKNDTTQKKAVFGLNGAPVAVQLGKTYQFQVRSEKTAASPGNSKFSGWSPTLSVKL